MLSSSAIKYLYHPPQDKWDWIITAARFVFGLTFGLLGLLDLGTTELDIEPVLTGANETQHGNLACTFLPCVGWPWDLIRVWGTDSLLQRGWILPTIVFLLAGHTWFERMCLKRAVAQTSPGKDRDLERIRSPEKATGADGEQVHQV